MCFVAIKKFVSSVRAESCYIFVGILKSLAVHRDFEMFRFYISIKVPQIFLQISMLWENWRWQGEFASRKLKLVHFEWPLSHEYLIKY